MSRPAFERLFSPRSVAVIGASRHRGKIGNTLITNLKKTGFTGHLYPVNPQADTVAGLTCYPDIAAVPNVPDLAVVVVPGGAVLEAVRACGQKGVPFLIVISAGFKESGSEGMVREAQLKQIVAEYHMRLVGPNCLGLMSTVAKLNATFASPADTPVTGELAFISQSGALGTAILDVSVTNPLFGLRAFVSLGNKADIDEAELIRFLGQDPDTKAIALYIEGLTAGRDFVAAAAAVSAKTPILVLKSGRTASGQHAISSHTGSLAGSDTVFDAAMTAAGVLRVGSFQELIDVSTLCIHTPRLKRNRIAIVTNAGGPAILATDALPKHNLVLSQFHRITTQRLHRVLPPSAATHNPVDILGDALSQRYADALSIVIPDSEVDAVLVVLTPQSMTEIDTTAQVIAQAAQHRTKPVIACFMGDHRVENGRKLLAASHVPVFTDPDQAVTALGGWYKYSLLQNQAPRNWRNPTHWHLPAMVANRLEQARAQRQPRLSLLESLTTLEDIGIGVTPSQIVTSASQAESQASAWGWPVVLKIDSPALNHKSDQGGVVINLSTPAQVSTAYQQLSQLIERSGWDQATIIMQPQAPTGLELLIGAKQDPIFGPVVTVAAGGIYVEVMRDAVTSLAPISPDEAERRLLQMKLRPILEGVRGQKGVHLAKLADIVSKLSYLISACPEISEIDINPVFAYSDEALAVDARMILST